MEVAAMSISAREQQGLDFIETELAGSGPKLASLRATFARLTSGNDMPVRGRIWAVRRRGVLGASLPGRRPGFLPDRHLGFHLGFRQAVAWLWLVIAVVLVAVALVTSSGSRGTCARPWPAACAVPASGGSVAHQTAVNPAGRAPG
jgi:hypothetical protein